MVSHGAKLTAVWATELPQIEYLFDLIECQVLVLNGTRNVCFPEEVVTRTFMFEGEEES
jgi:hypothetical protein